MSKLTWRFLGAVAIIILYQNCGHHMTSNQSSVALLDAQAVDSTDRDHSPDPGMIQKDSTSFQPVLVDREYAMALLADIFGTTAPQLIAADLSHNLADFGSPCSVYENYRAYNTAGTLVQTNTLEACALNEDGQNLGAAVLPSGSVTREASMAHACATLIADAGAFQSGLSRIDSAAVPAPTTQNVSALLDLFYRDKPTPDAGVVEAVQILIDPASPTLDQWRAAFYTVCVSTDWQVL